MNLLGAMYAAVLFLGATNASAVQSVVAIERTVFYRERAAGMYSELPYAFAQVMQTLEKIGLNFINLNLVNLVKTGYSLIIMKTYLIYFFCRWP